MAIVRDYDGDTTSASYSAVVTPRVHLITAYDFGEPATAPPEATLAPVTIAPDYEDPRYTITIADGRPYTLSLITAYDPRAADSREVYLPPLSIIRDYDSGTGTSARRYNAAPLEIVIDFDESVRTTLPALIIAR